MKDRESEDELKKEEIDGRKEEKISQEKKRERRKETRPDTRLRKSQASGQGPYLRSLDHLGRSSEVRK